MQYYHANTVQNKSFEQVIKQITAALQEEGFGILTEIDLKETMKKKLDVELRPYTILGACNPSFAYQALQAENKIGTMLPCNVIVQELEQGIEVAAVDPVASMQAVGNESLSGIADEVRNKLMKAIERVK